MSIFDVIYQNRFIIAVIATIGFVLGFGHVKMRPETWSSKVVIIPESPVKIRQMVSRVFIEELGISEDDYQFQGSISSKNVDNLFRTFKYLLTTQAARQDYLSKNYYKRNECLSDAITNIDFFQPDTQVANLVSYRLIANASCPEVKTYLADYMDKVADKALVPIVLDQVRAMASAFTAELKIVRYRSREMRMALHNIRDNIQVEVQTTIPLQQGGIGKIINQLTQVEAQKELNEITERELVLTNYIDRLNVARDTNKIPALVSSVEAFKWVLTMDESFFSSKEIDTRPSFLYGFIAAALLVILWLTGVMLKQGYVELRGNKLDPDR